MQEDRASLSASAHVISHRCNPRLLLSGMTLSHETETFLFDVQEDEPHHEERFHSKECVGLHQHLELLFFFYLLLDESYSTNKTDCWAVDSVSCTLDNIHRTPVLLSSSSEEKVSVNPDSFAMAFRN